MYCSGCGTEMQAGLNYCNRCGNRVTAIETDKHGTPGKMLDNVLTTLFLLVMFGLGILVGLVAVMLGNNVKTEVVTLIVLAYLATVFTICLMLLRQVPKLIDAKLRMLNGPSSNPDALPQRSVEQLGEYREPPVSVTDRTTRTLDKVPSR